MLLDFVGSRPNPSHNEQESTAESLLSNLADKWNAIKVFWAMRSQVHFRSKVLACLVSAQVIAAEPETAVCYIVDFSLVSYVGGVAAFSIVFRELFKTKLLLFRQTKHLYCLL